MSSGCGDVLSLEDLRTAKKHQLFEAEVITGKQGGVATGANIDYATNQATGQVQKTLPAVLRDAGFEPVEWTFTTGGVLGAGDRNKIVYDPVSQNWYSYSGTLPVTVPAGYNPVGNSNWVPQTDKQLRTELRIVVATFLSVSEMLQSVPADGAVANVLSYHANLGYGGGLFRYDASALLSSHDGGHTINPSVSFPTDWTNQTQVHNWFYPASGSTGAWVRQDGDIHDATNYGAKKDGSVLINEILNRLSDNNIAIYLPRGKYKVENFVRNIPTGGNINMTSMILYGEPTYGGTDQTYSWDTVSVIQGSGDLFTDVVNTAIRDIYFRNTPGSTKGKLFTLGAYAQCEIANCVFGPSDYHFYNPGFGITGYNVKPYFRNCRFYAAESWSRYFEGTVAGYHEQDCYTSHNKKGLFLAAPVSSAITDCIFEYNDDRAIECNLYGYNSASYQLAITNTFFETNGAGDTASYKTRSDSHVVIRSVKVGNTSEPDAGAADMRLILDNVSFVDLNTNNVAYGAVCIDSKTTMISLRGCRIEPAISAAQKILTGSEAFYVDPVGRYGDGKTSVTSLDFDLRAQHIRSGATSMFYRHGGSTLGMLTSGLSCVFGTVVQTGSVSLTLTTVPGAVVNGDVFVTLSGNGGYAAYKFRVTGTSASKTITLVDSKEVGGFTGNLITFGDPSNFVLNAQNNGPTANITVNFVGTVQ